MAVDFNRVERFFEIRELGVRERHVPRPKVLKNPLFPFGARDRNDVRVFMQHPGERYLRRSRLFFFGEPIQDIEDRLIRDDVFF